MILHLWLHNYVDVNNANIDNNYHNATGIGKLNIGYDFRSNPHLTHLVLWNISPILKAQLLEYFIAIVLDMFNEISLVWIPKVRVDCN